MEAQKLKGQLRAWRNLAAAQEELNQANYALNFLHVGTQGVPRRVNAINNYKAARAAVEASLQQDDSDPDRTFSRNPDQDLARSLHL